MKKNKIIITTITLLLIISTILISIPIYKNAYNTNYDNNDVICTHTIFNEKLTINITPLTNIKDFKYCIYFSPEGEKIEFKKDIAIANQPITHTFYTEEIKSEYLNGKDYTSFGWNIISGKVQNKLKNKERNYDIPSNTECKLSFELKTKEKINSEVISYEDWILYCTIKNNTNKNILSIQNCIINATFTGNMDAEIYIENIDFKETLKPGNITVIKIENPIINNKNLSQDIVKEKYNNLVNSTNIHKQNYSIVYEN